MTARLFAIGLSAVLLLVLGSSVSCRGGDGGGSSARRLVERGALLLDVRTPAEFATDHIPGAINIPVQELDRRMGELGPKDKPVVVYCQSGRRSGRAARMLKEAGYAAVHDLGAMSRW